MSYSTIRAMMVSAILTVATIAPDIGCAASQGVVVANSGGKQTAQFRQWQQFRKAIDAKSNGSLLLDYLIYGELGTASSMLQAVTSGRASIGGFSCAGITSTIPEFAVPQMPYLFASDDEYDFVFDKDMTPIFSEILANRGLVFLQWTDMGWMDLYSREPVQFPEQLESQSVRTVDNIVGPALLKAIKAVPVEVSVSNIVSPSVGEKLFGTFGILRTYGRVQPNFKYLTLTRHSHNCGVVVANKAWFDSITPHEQDVVRSAYPGLSAEKQAVADEEKSLLAQAGDSGAVILQLTPTQRNAWAATGLPLYPLILEQAGGRSIEVYDKIRVGKQAYLRDPASGTVH